MSEGRMEQVGAPFAIYNFPATRFVASFVGTLNIMEAKVLDPASGRIAIDGQEVVMARSLGSARAGDIRSVALRPEAVTLAEAGEGANGMTGTIEDVAFLGSVVRIRVRFEESAVSLDTFNHPGLPPPAVGTEVAVAFGRDDLLPLEAG
jgi:putative spermidine/putrescine transport system ATP-binding protein